MESSEPLTIRIKTLEGQPLEITVPNSNATVLELKARISSQTNVAETSQRLIFNGKVLKDADSLSVYAIKNGHFVHMVQRPANGSAVDSDSDAVTASGRAPVPSSAAASSQQHVATPAVPPPAQRPGAPLRATQQSAAASGFAHARTLESGLLQRVRALRSRYTHGAASSADDAPTPAAGDDDAARRPPIVQLGGLLSRASKTLSDVQPLIAQLGALLADEPSLTGPQRDDAQSLASQMDPILNQMGAYFSSLGASLHTLQLGSQPGLGQVSPPGSAACVQDQPPRSPRGRAAGSAPAPMNLATVMHTVSAMLASNPAFAQPSARQPAEVSAAFDEVARMFGNMQQQLQQQQQAQLSPSPSAMSASPQAARPHAIPASPGAAGPSAAQSGDVVAHMTQMLSSYSSADPLSSSAEVTPEFTEQLMRLLQSAGSPAALFNSAATRPASAAPVTAASVAGAMDASMLNGPALMLSQAFNSISHAVSSGQRLSVNTVIDMIAANVTPPGAPPNVTTSDSVLGQTVKKVFATLSVQDLLSIMNGNWAPMECLHDALRRFLLHDVLNLPLPPAAPTADASLSLESAPPPPAYGDLPPLDIKRYADRISDELIRSLHSALDVQHFPESVKALVRSGHDIGTVSLAAFRRHTVKLVTLILCRSPADAAIPPAPGFEEHGPPSFAAAVRDWTVGFIQDLVERMSDALINGLNDAAPVIRFFFYQRMLFLGHEFAQMAANIVTSYVMRSYSATRAVILEATKPEHVEQAVHVHNIDRKRARQAGDDKAAIPIKKEKR